MKAEANIQAVQYGTSLEVIANEFFSRVIVIGDIVRYHLLPHLFILSYPAPLLTSSELHPDYTVFE
jgi:hypothetical protein